MNLIDHEKIIEQWLRHRKHREKHTHGSDFLQRSHIYCPGLNVGLYCGKLIWPQSGNWFELLHNSLSIQRVT
jgi:hypothetical protein